MGKGIALEVDAAALPGGAEDLRDGSLDTLVGVADDQLHTPQTPAIQTAQELRPEGLGLAGSDLEPQHLALAFGVLRNLPGWGFLAPHA